MATVLRKPEINALTTPQSFTDLVTMIRSHYSGRLVGWWMCWN